MGFKSIWSNIKGNIAATQRQPRKLKGAERSEAIYHATHSPFSGELSAKEKKKNLANLRKWNVI